MEYWQVIEGWSDYEISDHGRVRSRPRFRPSGDPSGAARWRPGKVLKPHMNRDGYLRVNLTAMNPDGSLRRGKGYVHRLVAKHWLVDPPGETVNHKDLDKTHNHWENLEWMTRVENAEHVIVAYNMRGNPNWVSQMP